MTPWWCVRGTMLTVVDAPTEQHAVAMACRKLRTRRGPGEPDQVAVRPATPEDLDLWAELLARQAAGVEGARVTEGPDETVEQVAMF